MSNGYFSPTVTSKYVLARASVPNNTETKTEAAFDKLPTEANIKQGKINYAVDSGAADVYVVTLPHAPSAYGDGLLVNMKVGDGNTNTGPCTVDVNELGVVSIKDYAGNDPAAGDFPAGSVVSLRHNGTNFRIVGASYSAGASYAAAAAASASAAAADVVLTNADVVLTHADVVTTGSNVTSAQNAQAAAEAAANGISWKAPVAVVATSNISLTGEQTIDGVLTSASRVLVTGQTATEENGIYVSSAGSWVRAVPLDTWDEHVSATVNVEQGTTYSDTEWTCTVDPGGTLGTTAITWIKRPLGDMKKSENLAGLASASASRSNLGIDGSSGNIATGDLAAAAVTIAKLAADAKAYDIAMIAGFDNTMTAEDLVVQTYSTLIAPRAITLTGEQLYMDTAPTGLAAVFDIEKNGVSVYSIKPQVAALANAGTAGTLSTTTIAAGDRITFKCTQAGSTIAGGGARFTLAGVIS